MTQPMEPVMAIYIVVLGLAILIPFDHKKTLPRINRDELKEFPIILLYILFGLATAGVVIFPGAEEVMVNIVAAMIGVGIHIAWAIIYLVLTKKPIQDAKHD